MINQLKTRLAVSEQEVKDKDEVMKKTSDLLHTEQEHKVQGLQVKPCIISGGGELSVIFFHTNIIMNGS